MIITLIILGLIYLLIIWFGNFVIDTVFGLLNSSFVDNQSKLVAYFSIALQFIVGIFLRLYLLTKLCKYYIEKKEDLTIFILIIIYLGFSLMKTIYKQPINEERNSKKYFQEEAQNMISGMINSVGVSLSIILFVLYYFNHAILFTISSFVGM